MDELGAITQDDIDWVKAYVLGMCQMEALDPEVLEAMRQGMTLGVYEDARQIDQMSGVLRLARCGVVFATIPLRQVLLPVRQVPPGVAPAAGRRSDA